MSSLNKFVALVTGGSKGIGAAIVKDLAKKGAIVYFCARESKEFTNLIKESLKNNYQVIGIIADVNKKEDIDNIYSTIKLNHGKLDILVNNVGGAIQYGSFFELDDETWTDVYNFNVLTTVRFVKGAYELLLKSNLKRIINISSIVGIQPGFFNPHYSITKSAIINLSKHLSKILAKDKILVNVICPGSIHTEAWIDNVKAIQIKNNISYQEAWENLEEEEIKKIPLGRVGEPEDISSAVIYLCSEGASWITGSILNINGGKISTAI